MTSFNLGTKAALLASTVIAPASIATSAHAQDNTGVLEEIIVTATKRESNLQDVPLSVQVLGNTQLENLNVNGFDDYVEFLPTVSYLNSRPGVAQVYMRGIASGGDGNHSASMPSVGVYLDEQPITTIGQILDLHIYDINRIETLSGPQGTLFGASSQAGTMRIITNKPDPSGFEAGYDASLNTIKSGEMGYILEGFVNAPISDNAAIRLVGWHEEAGGYIDNVPGELYYQSADITRSNADLVEEDFNDTTTTGARALLKVDLNDNWTVSPGLTYQKQKSTGVFSHRPDTLGDLQTQQFSDTFYDEKWYQAALTVEGQIGDLNLVYAGSYLDRDVDSLYDYSGYVEYYESWSDNCYAPEGGYYAAYYGENTNCNDPTQHVTGDETFSRQSHEFRVQSSQDSRLRWIAGLFYQRQTHDFDLRWTSPEYATIDSVIEGDHVSWQTREVRIDRDKAAFGEVSYDFTDRLSATAGIRLFEYENSLEGFYGMWLWHCIEIGGYVCYDNGNLDDVKKGSGESYKLNINYQIDDNKMVYATYSEGFRAGGVNRARVANVPSYDPDFVTNYELGWKVNSADNRVRFNGAVYLIDWDNFQMGTLDMSVSLLTIIYNRGQARTKGAEFDLDFAASENLTLSLSGSFNDAKTTIGSIRTNTDGDVLGTTPKGTKMPYTPNVQFTAIGRYHGEIGEMPAFAQAALSYTGSSWSDLEIETRVKQSGYTLLNLSAGISGDNWALRIAADNITDKRAQLSHNYPGYDSVVDTNWSTNRPRTLSISFGQSF